MSLQLRRIGGFSEEEHVADVDGKVAEIPKDNDCVEVGGRWNACCTTPSVCLQKEGQASCGQLRICSSQPVNRGVRQRERAVVNNLGDKFKSYIKKELSLIHI